MPGIIWMIAFIVCYVDARNSTVFLLEPKSTIALPGDTVIFRCYSPEPYPPHWKINGVLYNRRNLPPRYESQSRGLNLIGAEPEDNTTSYQCVYTNGIRENQSKVAMLKIVIGNIIKVANNIEGSWTKSCFVIFPEVKIKIKQLKMNFTANGYTTNKTVMSFTSPENVCSNITNSSCFHWLVSLEVRRENVFSPIKMYMYNGITVEECRSDGEFCDKSSVTTFQTTTDDEIILTFGWATVLTFGWVIGTILTVFIISFIVVLAIWNASSIKNVSKIYHRKDNNEEPSKKETFRHSFIL